MKARLSLAFTAFALILTLTPAFAAPADVPTCFLENETQAAPEKGSDLLAELTAEPQRQEVITSQQCSYYCARVRCGGDQICGLYTNSSGQQACGCHNRF